MKLRKILIILFAALLLITNGCEKKKEAPMEETTIESEESSSFEVEQIASIPSFAWQKDAFFPDRLGKVDDTLAMNSILSFKGYADQGTLYIKVSEEVSSFDLYINSFKCEEKFEAGASYRIDYSEIALNGMNDIQISHIQPKDLQNAVEVCVPYPEVIQGDLKEEGFREEAFELISDIIQSDIEHGFSSAQLAVLRHGKLIYANTWGDLNSYEPDGTRIKEGIKANNDTMYDLASVTKMFSANYALQKLISEGKISLYDKAYEYLGEGFYEDVLDFCYDFGQQVSVETMKEWKASITIEDLISHQAGFPSAPRYFNIYVDAPSQDYLPEEGYNLLYSGSEHNDETRQKTLQAIFETPLLRRPGTKYQYSDVDYMTLAFIIEKVSGMDLDTYMKKEFFEPLGLNRISYEPLRHGYTKDDCAATELNGNTRDGVVYFPGIREYTLQGEVHDEMAYYSMNGVSGHAGLFSNATDLGKLATLMLTGGYGGYRFFDQNVIDAFISPLSHDNADNGLGWARQGDDQRSWYFGSDASSFTIGHQGWTGTLVMIDPSRDLIVVYLTNERNTRVLDPYENANDFNGLYYTASTLGFVSQILSIGLDQDIDIKDQLKSLVCDMADGAEKLIVDSASKDHPSYLNYLSKLSVKEKWTGD